MCQVSIVNKDKKNVYIYGSTCHETSPVALHLHIHQGAVPIQQSLSVITISSDIPSCVGGITVA